jgi:hypothetical protein
MFGKCKNLVLRVVLGLALLGAVSATVSLGARAAAHRAHRAGAVHSIEKAHFAPDVHFISGLMAHKAPFLVAERGEPQMAEDRIEVDTGRTSYCAAGAISKLSE